MLGKPTIWYYVYIATVRNIVGRLGCILCLAPHSLLDHGFSPQPPVPLQASLQCKLSVFYTLSSIAITTDVAIWSQHPEWSVLGDDLNGPTRLSCLMFSKKKTDHLNDMTPLGHCWWITSCSLLILDMPLKVIWGAVKSIEVLLFAHS